MASSTEAITSSLQLLDEAKQSYLAGGANSTEAVLDAARAILVAGGQDPKASSVPSNTDHEKPSDFLQRVMWAEVRILAPKSTTSRVSHPLENDLSFQWSCRGHLADLADNFV